MSQSKVKLSERKFFPYTVGAVGALAVVFVFSVINSLNNYSTGYYGDFMVDTDYGGESYNMMESSLSSSKMAYDSYSTPSVSESRVITNNYFSVHVDSVEKYHADIKDYVSEIDGKVMSEDINESSSASESGTIRVFIPNAEVESFLGLLEANSIKIVSQSVNSYEVSSEYADISRSIEQLEDTYSKVLSFYENAESVSDLVSVQNQLTNLQSQIDSYKGMQRSLKERSENTEFTIYSGTNEYDLPYIPDGTFEIAKTFKYAIRSLVAFADSVFSMLIYVLVFAPVWLSLLGVFAVVRKRKMSQK